MKPISFMPALLVLSAAVAVAFMRDITWVIAALPVSLALNISSWRSISKAKRAMLPVALFVLTLIWLQWLYRRPEPMVAAKTLAVFWLTTAAFRRVPRSGFAGAIRPGSRTSAFILYLLFLRHFASILAVEAGRLLHARSRAVPKPYGHWAFRSLAAALVSLLVRAATRAERFYAALLLKGLVE
jgi:hypothetical protein